MLTYDIYSSDYYSLASKFQVDPDSCANPDHYNTYLTQNAYIDHQKGLATTYVFLDDEKEKTIIGYISIKATALIDEMEDAIVGYPALEVAELAVSKDYSRKGYGKKIMKFAINLAVELSEKIGIRYVLVCADPMAVEFYKCKGLEFRVLADYTGQLIPRESWNTTCVPMAKQLMELP